MTVNRLSFSASFSFSFSFALGLALAIPLATATHARADDAHASSNPMLAQTLFDDAVKLMDQGRFADACPKLAESQRLDPGGGTLLNLGFCRQNEGKLASAWAAYDEALSQAIKDGRKDREGAARLHVTELAAKVAKLEVDLVAAARATTGLEVRLDGTPIRQAAWGVLTPIDRGTHGIVVIAPGKREYRTEITVEADGIVKHVSIPALADAPVSSGGGGGGNESHGSGQRVAGWVTGGLGIVLLGVGVTTGALAFDYRGKSDAECPSNQCTQKGVDLNEQAKTYAWVSDFTVGFGVAATGLGVVLLLTAPKGGAHKTTGTRVLPLVGAGVGGFAVSGSF